TQVRYVTVQTEIDGQMTSSGQTEINHWAKAATEAWLRANIAFERTGAPLVSSRALIDGSRCLLATIQATRTGAPVASRRAVIDESRQLLATVQGADLPPTPHPKSRPEAVTVARSDDTSVNPAVPHLDPAFLANPALLSVRIIPSGGELGWSVFSTSREMLGRGIADTELKARTEAFGAGMTFIERLKGRCRPTDSSVH